MTTQDLLDAWREATRATAIAERLADLAIRTAAQSELDAASAEEVARLAEEAAMTAAAVAERARTVAMEARRVASGNADTLTSAEMTRLATEDFEHDAADAYHDAEARARERDRP